MEDFLEAVDLSEAVAPQEVGKEETMKTNELLPKKSRQEIEKAVKNAESKTSAEFVWSVQTQSNEYKIAQFLFAIIFSIFITAILTAIEVIYGWGSWSAIASVELVLFFLLGMFFGKTDFIRRMFVSHEKQKKAVKEKATRMFSQFGLSETKERNGVFIYVSLFERLSYIIFDKGITDEETKVLDKEMRKIMKGTLNKKSVVNGLSAAIEYAGEKLKTRFPRKADDVNELPDSCISE